MKLSKRVQDIEDNNAVYRYRSLKLVDVKGFPDPCVLEEVQWFAKRSGDSFRLLRAELWPSVGTSLTDYRTALDLESAMRGKAPLGSWHICSKKDGGGGEWKTAQRRLERRKEKR